MRAPTQGPRAILPGHEYAVRKLAWSPHLSDVLLSASYDMTCRVWTDGSSGVETEGEVIDGSVPPSSGINPASNGALDDDPMAYGGGRELGRMGRHTEFAMGVDWCLFGAEGWCASCGWDERVLIWDVATTYF